MGLDARKPVFRGLPTTEKQTDQRLCYSLLENLISKLAIGKISTFLLVSVAGETGLILALSETWKTGFVASRLMYLCTVLFHCSVCFTGRQTASPTKAAKKIAPGERNKIFLQIKKIGHI